MTDSTAASGTESSRAHVTSLEVGKGAEGSGDRALEIRIVGHGERLKGVGEGGREWCRETVGIEVKLDEAGEGGYGGWDDSADGGRR